MLLLFFVCLFVCCCCCCCLGGIVVIFVGLHLLASHYIGTILASLPRYSGTVLASPPNFTSQFQPSLTLPAPRRQPVIAYSMNARRERVWDTTVPRCVLAPPELGWGQNKTRFGTVPDPLSPRVHTVSDKGLATRGWQHETSSSLTCTVNGGGGGGVLHNM